jgi:hypothetical protein
VVFVTPTTFGNGEDGATLSVVKVFLRRGYHVVTLPSPMSLDWINSRTKTAALDLSSEADVAYRSMRAMISAIGRARISTTHLVGESYGSFLAAVVAAKDAMSRDPLFDSDTSSVTMISPPLSFPKAFKKIDGYADDSQAHWDAKYEGKTSVGAILDIVLAKRAISFSAETIQDSMTIFAHKGFKEEAARSVIRFSEVWGLEGVNPEGLSKREWVNRLRLKDALGRISSQGAAFLADPVRSDIGYWLALAARSGSKAAIRLVAAKDDPLNDLADWHGNPHFDLSGHATLLQNGGHYGFVPMKSFDAFLASGYPEPTPAPKVASGRTSTRSQFGR